MMDEELTHTHFYEPQKDFRPFRKAASKNGNIIKVQKYERGIVSKRLCLHSPVMRIISQPLVGLASPAADGGEGAPMLAKISTL